MTALFTVVNPFEWAGKVVGGALSDAAMAPLVALANAVADAAGTTMGTLATAWVKIDTPNLAAVDGRPSATVGFLQGELAYAVAFCAVMALIVGGVRMVWEGRAEPARDVLQGLITLAVVSGCGLATVGLVVSASDELADSIIDDVTGGAGFGRSVTQLVASAGAVAPFLVTVLGLLVVAVSVAQIGLLIFRAGALVLLAGFLPLAAATASTPGGRAHLRKFVAWIVALAAYKPAVALCYAAAFKLVGTNAFGQDGVLSILVGLALMVTAVVAMPALVKFLVPAVGAVTIGGGSHETAGIAAAAAAMPIGARMIGTAHGLGGGDQAGPRGAGSAGPSGSGGTPGPSGGSGPTSAGGGPGSPGAAGAAGPAMAGAGGVSGAPGPAGGTGPSAGASRAAGGAQGASGAAGMAGAAAGPAGAAVGAAAGLAQGAKQKVTAGAGEALDNTHDGGPDGSVNRS